MKEKNILITAGPTNEYIDEVMKITNMSTGRLGIELTKNYSGADIEEVCDRAKEEPLYKAIKTDSIVMITMKDFLNALKQVPPTVDLNSLKLFEDFEKNKITL